MKMNWNFLGGGGVPNKTPSVGGVWIFSGTAPSKPLRFFFFHAVQTNSTILVL